VVRLVGAVGGDRRGARAQLLLGGAGRRAAAAAAQAHAHRPGRGRHRGGDRGHRRDGILQLPGPGHGDPAALNPACTAPCGHRCGCGMVRVPREREARMITSLRLPAIALATMMLGACASAPDRAASATGTFVERELALDGRTHRYQVFVPARADAAAKAPVILFLHGSGERGDDNRRQLEVGLGPRVRAAAAEFPAIVVFPQALEGAEWNQLVDVVVAQLEAATREFGGDPDRTYLTGLSMGGYGAWDLALREPGRFAALVPVCGGLLHPRRPSMAVGGLE